MKDQIKCKFCSQVICEFPVKPAEDLRCDDIVYIPCQHCLFDEKGYTTKSPGIFIFMLIPELANVQNVAIHSLYYGSNSYDTIIKKLIVTKYPKQFKKACTFSSKYKEQWGSWPDIPRLFKRLK